MSNLGQYIDDVRLYVGDIGSTEFDNTTILTALENGIKYLGKRWYNRYLIFSSGIIANSSIPGIYTVNTPNGTMQVSSSILEGDVFRNSAIQFVGSPPPIIEESDLPAVFIAASYLLRRAKASSSTAGLSWSTPDLTYSNIQSAKTYLQLMEWDNLALDLFFKQHLGRPIVGSFALGFEPLDARTPLAVAQWCYRLASKGMYSKI